MDWTNWWATNYSTNTKEVTFYLCVVLMESVVVTVQFSPCEQREWQPVKLCLGSGSEFWSNFRHWLVQDTIAIKAWWTVALYPDRIFKNNKNPNEKSKNITWSVEEEALKHHKVIYLPKSERGRKWGSWCSPTHPPIIHPLICSCYSSTLLLCIYTEQLPHTVSDQTVLGGVSPRCSSLPSLKGETKTPAQIHDQHHGSGAHECPETACLSAIRVLFEPPPAQ